MEARCYPRTPDRRPLLIHLGTVGRAAALALAGILAFATVVAALAAALALTGVLSLTGMFFFLRVQRRAGLPRDRAHRRNRRCRAVVRWGGRVNASHRSAEQPGNGRCQYERTFRCFHFKLSPLFQLIEMLRVDRLTNRPPRCRDRRHMDAIGLSLSHTHCLRPVRCYQMSKPDKFIPSHKINFPRANPALAGSRDRNAPA